MIKLDDYRAFLQSLHELAKLIFFFGISSFGLLITLGFGVVWFKQQLCFCQMMHDFKLGGI